MEEIENIIGKQNARGLQAEFEELMDTEGTTYDDIEELLLDYGLEMDYVMDLLCM